MSQSLMTNHILWWNTHYISLSSIFFQVLCSFNARIKLNVTWIILALNSSKEIFTLYYKVCSIVPFNGKVIICTLYKEKIHGRTQDFNLWNFRGCKPKFRRKSKTFSATNKILTKKRKKVISLKIGENFLEFANFSSMSAILDNLPYLVGFSCLRDDANSRPKSQKKIEDILDLRVVQLHSLAYAH